jgi:two-component system response regulator FixJ
MNAVFVIDDDEAARDSLVYLMRTGGLASRAFASAREFLDQLHASHSGCIITDVRMPGMDGMALIEALDEIGCRMPIIVVTGHADVSLAVKAMKSGVTDFIEKPFESDTILSAVHRALEAAVSRDTLERQRAAVERRRETLTEREQQVLALVTEGYSNKEIANELKISFRTVEIYRANVMLKMQAESLSALVRMSLMLDAA